MYNKYHESKYKKYYFYNFVFVWHPVKRVCFAEVPPEKLQEQIKAASGKFRLLQADLRELQVKQTAAPTAIKPENKDLLSPDGFARELMRGSAGEDVKQLQVILQQFSNVYPEKIVSGYYGALTEKAVQRFQKEYGLPSVGRVGPKTQAVLNQLLSRLTIPEPKLSSMDAAVTELPKAFEPTPAVTPMPKTEAELKAKLDLESKAEPTALPAPTLTGTPVATSTSLATPTPIAVPTPALKSAPEKHFQPRRLHISRTAGRPARHHISEKYIYRHRAQTNNRS